MHLNFDVVLAWIDGILRVLRKTLNECKRIGQAFDAMF